MNERTSMDLVPNLIRGHRRNGRTVYDKDAKRELARRCLQPGVSLAGTALAHGLNANLLRRWVVQYTGRSRQELRQSALVPVATMPLPQPQPTPPGASGEWELELTVPGGAIRMRGKVEAETLRTVLDCLAGRV